MYDLFDYDKISEFYDNELREEGKAEGRAEAKLRICRQLLEDGILSIEEIVAKFGVDEESLRQSK